MISIFTTSDPCISIQNFTLSHTNLKPYIFSIHSKITRNRGICFYIQIFQGAVNTHIHYLYIVWSNYGKNEKNQELNTPNFDHRQRILCSFTEPIPPVAPFEKCYEAFSQGGFMYKYLKKDISIILHRIIILFSH